MAFLLQLFISIFFVHTITATLEVAQEKMIDQVDSNGNTPLISAVKLGIPAIVDLLIAAGADIDKPDTLLENTPLMWATKCGHTGIAIKLIEACARIDQQNIYGCSALHIAAQEDRNFIARLLVHARADVNLREDIFGNTALLIAAQRGNLDLYKILETAGAHTDIYNIRHRDDASSLAVKNFKQPMLDYLTTQKKNL